ncbi:hypothetical protein SS50377_24918 [Spironucleus salmonicida]|uniref:Uncharacterized protein n=1 Tax=Spironucleus salmonicida TaxID=348837 RepID=V6LRP0_9EUKA|nr:hypothetical protein SS50377_24918 [Spironucleus salmonicida]|eukprot:EST43449.1 Hypothetical protein SS50377_16812 [Spironucleus salmonicida]
MLPKLADGYYKVKIGPMEYLHLRHPPMAVNSRNIFIRPKTVQKSRSPIKQFSSTDSCIQSPARNQLQSIKTHIRKPAVGRPMPWEKHIQ